ncbi:unnamed protein product, partial [Trichobilharzia szidati]
MVAVVLILSYKREKRGFVLRPTVWIFLRLTLARGIGSSYTKMTLRAGASNVSFRAWRRYFTLSSVDSVIELMREVFASCGVVFSDEQMSMKCLKSNTINSLVTADVGVDSSSSAKEPNLAFVSIVLGYIENHLTCSLPEEFDSLKLKNGLHHKVLQRRKELSSQNYSRSRSSSFTKSQSPLSVHLETSEEHLDSPSDNRELDSKSSSLSRSLSSSSFAQEITQNTSHTNESPVCRRRRTRQLGSSRRVRQRNESGVSDSTGSTIESLHTNTPKDEPLQIITDMPVRKRRRFSDSTLPNSSFPCLTFDELERLYLNFYNLITTSPKLKPFIETSCVINGTELKTPKSQSTSTTTIKKYASRSLICAICEVLWSQMAVSRVKERLTHTQSVYSFLTTGILDSFGLAYTVVAACQLLGYSDVDLALSEDHGWVEFGPPESRQTADVASWAQESHTSTNLHSTEAFSSLHNDVLQQTEHLRTRKASSVEDECNPPPIRIPPLEHSWLYVNGYPVICRPRIMAVAAAIAAIQPGASISAVTHAPTSEPFAYGMLSPNPSVSSGGDLITPTGLVRHLSSASVISMQLVTLKHRLLWLCFDAGCLSRYPLGLTNLGDLEDAFPTMGRLATFLNSSTLNTPTDLKGTGNSVDQIRNSENSLNHSKVSSVVMNPRLKLSSDISSNYQLPETVSLALALYNCAVAVNQYYYANHHVYPYTCLAGCLYRHGDHRGALRYWAEATKVIGHYNHTSEDWEIYRELLEVATHSMPQMFRLASENSRYCSEGLVDTDPDGCLYQRDNILDDPHCLSYLLSFYDHLCLWEEGSPVPVLHVGWVDKLMVNLTRFTQRARRHLCLSVASDKEDNKSDTVHSPSLTHSTCRSSRWATESTDTTSETGITSSVKRTTRRNRSYQIESTPNSSTVVSVKDEQLKSNNNVNNNIESVNENVKHKSSDTITQTVKGSKSRSMRSSKICNNITIEIPEERCNTNTTTRSNGELYSPHAKSTLSSTNTNSTFDDIHFEADQALDTEEQDGSPSPLVDFPNNGDLLASLVEACDHRLLNPAFLWGVEPHSPFLPANIAPEEALNRLMTVLQENKPASVLHNSSTEAVTAATPTRTMVHNIFPTPPNSGSFTELMGTAVSEEANSIDAITVVPLSPAKLSQTTQLSSNNEKSTDPHFPLSITKNESDSCILKTTEETLFPDSFDTVDGITAAAGDFDLLADIPNELMDSVASLVVENQTVSPTSNNPVDFFDLILESENNLHKTICNHHQGENEDILNDNNNNNNNNNNISNSSNVNNNNNNSSSQSPFRPSRNHISKTMEELSVPLSLYSV